MARGAARSPLLGLLLLLGSLEAASALRTRNVSAPPEPEAQLRSVSAPQWPGAPQPSYFFMAHHKTGTALANHLCDHMKRAVTGSSENCARCQSILNTTAEGGHWCWHYWSNGIKKERWAEFYNSSHHFFGGTPLGEVINKGGHNWRALHIIRDPLTTFASTYIYDQKGEDHAGAGKKELEHLTLPDGLRLKAQDGGIRLMQEMLQAHELAMSDKRVIELRFEDFRDNFDSTTARLFDFMTGGSAHLLFKKMAFQTLAAQEDQKRWSKKKLNQTHVSDPSREENVVSELRNLCAAGDKAITMALEPRKAMGYGVPCPGPDEQ